MEKIIEYRDLKNDCCIIDTRSPGEFEECHIPGAVNIPLFDDKQREMIGTVYKQESVDKAIKRGIECGSAALPDIYEKISTLKKQYKNIVVYCARGGMRSGSICSLLNALGMNLYQLRGGYKGYRAVVNEELPKIHESLRYYVLHGYTGVGKTEILKRLKNKGLDVLDLEECANHRGSFLGNVGIGYCNSQKHFEGLVYEILKNRTTNDIFVEAESKRIGSIIMGDYIKDTMNNGIHILIKSGIENRAKYIVEEYTKAPNCKKEIQDSLNKIRKYMGNDEVDRLIELIEQENYYEVAAILMEKYYDPMYEHTQKDYKYDLVVEAEDFDRAAEEIYEWYKRE